MNSKKHINTLLFNTNEAPNANDFLLIHAAFEAYLKHVGLLILRLKGVKSKEGSQYIRKIWIPCSVKSLRKLILTIVNKNINEANWTNFLKKEPVLDNYLKILFTYSSKVRNNVVHGNYYPFKEGELIFLLQFYKQLFEEMESIIASKYNGNRVLKNTPTNFGAPRGFIDSETKMKQLLSFSPSERALSFEKAQELFKEHSK